MLTFRQYLQEQQIDEFDFSWFTGMEKKAVQYIGPDGKIISKTTDYTSNIKKGLAALVNEKGLTHLSFIPGKAGKTVIEYLEREKPVGEVVLHLCEPSGATYRSSKIANWQQACNKLNQPGLLSATKLATA